MKKYVLILAFLGLVLLIAIGYFSDKSYEPTTVQKLKEQYSKKYPKNVDHSKFAILQQKFSTPQQVTKACETCHNMTAHQIMNSNHWNWERAEYIKGKGIVYLGKSNAINNFCIGTRGNEESCAKCHIGYGMDSTRKIFTDSTNIDCLVCHDNTETYAKANEKGGAPVPGLDYNKIAQNVGKPKRTNCGVCHFYGGGGNNVKHGDLEMSMFEPTKDIDVHMGVDGMNLQCVDCHTTKQHNISGKLYSLSSMNVNRNNCEQCHTSMPHERDILNEHTYKVACQTCHIPIYSKVNATKMYWDWSEAGKLKNGEPYVEEDSMGNHAYMSIKGRFIWKKDVKPDYIWFNGTATHYLLGDVINDTTKPLVLNQLYGSYSDYDSKIYPVKIHVAKQPYDPVNRILIQPKLYAPEKGAGAFWKDFNWVTASEIGMKDVGLPFSGKVSFIETEMYWPVNHMVSTKDKSVQCNECHTRKDSRLAKLSGFYMPGRDYSPFVDTAGTWLVVLTFLGILTHGLLRIILIKRSNNKKDTKKDRKLVYIYKGFERFWHWMQAILIFFLAFSGFEIHGTYKFLGYAEAVRYHNIAAYMLLILIVFAIFWHITTGEWKQYLPTIKNIKAQLNYYIFGIFKNAPHPTKKTVLSKLNPLQKLTYFGLKILVIPLSVTSGLLYMFYRYPTRYGIDAINVSSLEGIAIFHTIAAILLVAFIIAHLYLITTGETITSNLKAMLTGYEELEADTQNDKDQILNKNISTETNK